MFLPSTITLKFGDSGDFVTELQNRLVLTKCLTDGMVTGFYDGGTVNAVMMFQGREGLHADGVAGPETLRRLSGAISGSNGGAPTSNTTEEEQKIVPTEFVQQFVWGEQPQVNPFLETQSPSPAQSPIADIAPASPELRAAPIPQQTESLQVFTQTALLPSAPAISARELAAQQQSAPVVLAALAMPVTAQPIADPLQNPVNATSIPITQRPTNPPAEPAPVAATAISPTQPPVATTPQGLVAKTVQFTNAVIQKLADYFEKKLPPTVLEEVHTIGKEMHRSGLREAPIPTGPDQQRAPQLPPRAPEPTQAPQRG